MPLFSGGPTTYGGLGGANCVPLGPGGPTYVIGPEAGWYQVELSKYHVLQVYDPVTTVWRAVGGANTGSYINQVWSDGTNYRIANQTGCVVGAFISNNGSGYTSAPTVTISGQNSVWKTIVGGAVATPTITNGGSNYTYPPIVTFSPPPSPGIPASGYATLTSGVVTSITMIDQGAGYAFPPTITLSNDPREVNNPLLTTGYSAAAVASLTGSGTITALLCIDHGFNATPLSSVPSFTIAGGGGSSFAATPVMNFTITAVSVSSAGATLAGTVANITGMDAYPTGSPTIANPTVYNNLLFTRQAVIKSPITAGAITAVTIYDGGCYTSAPVALTITNAGPAATAAAPTFTLGGAAGVSYVMPIS